MMLLFAFSRKMISESNSVIRNSENNLQHFSRLMTKPKCFFCSAVSNLALFAMQQGVAVFYALRNRNRFQTHIPGKVDTIVDHAQPGRFEHYRISIRTYINRPGVVLHLKMYFNFAIRTYKRT